jgi:hypothetical protein
MPKVYDQDLSDMEYVQTLLFGERPTSVVWCFKVEKADPKVGDYPLTFSTLSLAIGYIRKNSDAATFVAYGTSNKHYAQVRIGHKTWHIERIAVHTTIAV